LRDKYGINEPGKNYKMSVYVVDRYGRRSPNSQFMMKITKRESYSDVAGFVPDI